MSKLNIHSIKTYLAISAFILFWILTFAFVFPTKIFRKKIPKIAWNYDQFFGQKWNFFTQPHLYNDRLVFVLKNSTNTIVTDSIDVLDELWKEKQKNAPFNTKEDVLDHIMFRQTAHLREAIENAHFFLKEKNKNSLNENFLKEVSSLVEADNINANTFYNIEAFGKIMLQKRGVKIDDHLQYKILFYTDYINSFASKKNVARSYVLDFESPYKYFNDTF